MRRALVLAVLAVLAGCAGEGGATDREAAPSTTSDAAGATGAPTAPDTTARPEPGEPDEPDRGPLPGGVIVNLRPHNTEFAALDPWIDGIGYVRVWGGSRGMTTYPSLDAVPEILRDRPGTPYVVPTADQIEALVELQRRHGVRIIYLVNVNDTLDAQHAFVARLLDEGLDLAMLELGNELYLRKYATGDLTAIGVTRTITVEDYIALLDEWVPRLRGFDLPLYVVGASHDDTERGRDVARRAWNAALLDALAARGDGFVDGVTFHAYGGEGRDDPADEDAVRDLGFLDTFGELPVAITESGYRFSEVTEANLDAAEAFWTELHAALGPRDQFGVHVMFGPPGRTGDTGYALFDADGRTPVGDRFAAWLADRRTDDRR